MKSLDQYDEERKQRKRLIKESLTNPKAKKHLKFDSDDEDDAQGKEFVQKKIQLFDDSEGINVDEHFNPSKETKTKRKLQVLQAKMSNTNDPRFQLSEKFLDEEHRDQNDEEDDEEQNDQQEISIEDEKKKSLAILDQITNAKTPTKPKSKSKMIRFDPSKTEHRIYELDSEVKINGHHDSPSKETPSKSILKAPKETAPIV